ncbi:MAG TPA: HD-GYP domain-containing protein, partial [Clostridiales bacterium]|nr:HD-GYP domain-containing protein [Clostridiales bacterium]
MRFIPTFCLQKGMLLGKSIYNKNGELLFEKGLMVESQYIEKITQLGIKGVYIDDHISKDIEIESIIDDGLRIKAVQKIKDIFIDIENDCNNIQENIGKMNIFVEDIVDELMSNKDVIVNMTDIKL